MKLKEFLDIVRPSQKLSILTKNYYVQVQDKIFSDIKYLELGCLLDYEILLIEVTDTDLITIRLGGLD